MSVISSPSWGVWSVMSPPSRAGRALGDYGYTRSCGRPIPTANVLGLASVVRLFASYQQGLDDATVLLGLELSPSA
jgi:hypothetical protein